MRTYEIYSSRGGKMQFELKIKGRTEAAAWVTEYLELNPGATAWKELRDDVGVRMPTWEVYTRIDGRLKFRGQRNGEANAEVYVKELLEKHPGAHAWCAPMCRYDDPTFM
jgi:hypothetical protein